MTEVQKAVSEQTEFVPLYTLDAFIIAAKEFHKTLYSFMLEEGALAFTWRLVGYEPKVYRLETLLYLVNEVSKIQNTELRSAFEERIKVLLR